MGTSFRLTVKLAITKLGIQGARNACLGLSDIGQSLPRFSAVVVLEYWGGKGENNASVTCELSL